MADWRRREPYDLDGALHQSLQDLARQVPVPDPDRVLTRPRALLAARVRERRRRAMTAVAGVAALFLLGVAGWQVQSRGPSAEDTAPPDTVVTLAAVEDRVEDLRFDVLPVEEAARRVPFPLHGPGWVPEGAVLVDVIVEQPAGPGSVTQVVMRFRGPGRERFELRQAGPFDKRFLMQSPPMDGRLDLIDIHNTEGLEWVQEGILFQAHGDWDEPAARRFVQSLQPLRFSGEGHPGDAAPVDVTPSIGID